jgi:cytosine/adenosine deaminase-related metal-dependent hydrolase
MSHHAPFDDGPDTLREDTDPAAPREPSRRDFLRTGAAGLAAAALPVGLFSDARGSGDAELEEKLGADRKGRRILLKGGIVMSLDPAVGDHRRADVLIEGEKIAAVGRGITADAQVIDASDRIVLPGFIDTHHHQYETLQRAIIADGLLQGTWPQQSYGSVVQNIFTTGRIPGVFDLGRSPYDPEDCYISELVASLNQIDQGITTGVDTSQSSHTPEHTDAMIEALRDSGRRTLFAYSGGRADSPGYEYPGRIGDTSRGLGRLRTQYFSSDDQLLTLGFGGGNTPVAGPDTETGWALARSFSAWIVNHNVGSPQTVIANQNDLGPDVEFIHCTRWTEEAWQIFADKGGKVSLAVPIEMQMRHGMPPIQQALDHNTHPSLSTDVETNMASDPFTLMRTTFTLQRALVNERSLAGEQNVQQPMTTRQAIEMATINGAITAGLDRKVGSITPGKQADLVLLATDRINTFPLNNVPGAVVTLMDTSNVDTVIIAGEVRKLRGRLLRVNIRKLQRDIENSRDRVLARVRSVFTGYTPSLFDSCCIPVQRGNGF